MRFLNEVDIRDRKARVSVCIPTYNSAKHLKSAIQSVLDQTYKDFELIIVDNNSSDNTFDIVSSYSDPRVYYLKNPLTVSMAENWNICVKAAKGEYVCLLHADDTYLSELLQNEVEVMSKDPEIGYVYSGVNFIDEQGKITNSSLPYNSDLVKQGMEQFQRHIFGNYLYCPSVMVKRQCYEKVGAYNPELKYLVDWDMWLRIALSSYKVAYIAKLLANYRMHQGSVSSSSKLVGSFHEVKEHYRIIRDNLTSTDFNEHYPKDKARELKDAVLIRYFIHYTYCRSKDFLRNKNIMHLLRDISYLFSRLFGRRDLHLSILSFIVAFKLTFNKTKKGENFI